MALSLVTLALAFSLQAEDPSPKGDACSLPRALSEALQQRFGSSRVLKASDLFEDERGLFHKEHPGGCPGIARGQFFGSGQRPAVAVILLDVEPKKNLRLVVARPALSAWTFVEVDEMDQGSTAVVGRKGPGTYTDLPSTKPRTTNNDVVTLTGYESWQRAYIWNGRAFDRLQIAQ
jgi:hypothetical protein